MCIRNLRKPKTSEESGVAYKVVEATEVKGEYKPQWPYFNKKGTGGSHTGGQRYIPNTVTYKIGKKYTVRHKRFAITNDLEEEKYPAGVHLYKSPVYKVGMRTVEFQYSKAVAIGQSARLREVIVAMSVKPIRDITGL